MLHDSLEVLCEDYMTGAEVEYSVSTSYTSSHPTRPLYRTIRERLNGCMLSPYHGVTISIAFYVPHPSQLPQNH